MKLKLLRADHAAAFFGVFGRALTGNVLMYLDSERNIAKRKENRIM